MTESAACSSQDSEDEMQLPRDVHIHASTQEAWLFKSKLTRVQGERAVASGRERRKKKILYHIFTDRVPASIVC